ncbi:MAG TPA: DUF397 domain-containing protein [Actinophytocola sp.]|jgi:hypothetical protein|uniref:DUF397 domain-containing protein n=1 Tax=Actinophytocola sp. TaxID=1872138 RepID=UPI002DFA6E65|nr:DUF397 domain-containing protein [Actinophytocola sp.]
MPATPVPNWRRSSFSGSGGNCVEAALLPADRFALRDSKHSAATLTLPHTSLTALLDTLRSVTG